MRYLFSDEEKLTLSMELAKESQEADRIKDHKKSVMADFNSQIAEHDERRSELAGKVTNGFEYRDVECEVEYHKPKKNQKTFVRVDTGEIFSELMDNSDMTLFNQWQMDHPEEETELIVKKFKFGTPENPTF